MFGVVAMKMCKEKHCQVKVFERLRYHACSATKTGEPVPLAEIVGFDEIGFTFCLN